MYFSGKRKQVNNSVNGNFTFTAPAFSFFLSIAVFRLPCLYIFIIVYRVNPAKSTLYTIPSFHVLSGA
jgi:hypothetical protein